MKPDFYGQPVAAIHFNRALAAILLVVFVAILINALDFWIPAACVIIGWLLGFHARRWLYIQEIERGEIAIWDEGSSKFLHKRKDVNSENA